MGRYATRQGRCGPEILIHVETAALASSVSRSSRPMKGGTRTFSCWGDESGKIEGSSGRGRKGEGARHEANAEWVTHMLMLWAYRL